MCFCCLNAESILADARYVQHAWQTWNMISLMCLDAGLLNWLIRMSAELEVILLSLTLLTATFFQAQYSLHACLHTAGEHERCGADD